MIDRAERVTPPPASTVQKPTERRDVHQHEVASLGNDGRHAGLPQDGGHAVPLALEFFRQRREVALGPTHQLKVMLHALSHGFLWRETEKMYSIEM